MVLLFLLFPTLHNLSILNYFFPSFSRRKLRWEPSSYCTKLKALHFQYCWLTPFPILEIFIFSLTHSQNLINSILPIFFWNSPGVRGLYLWCTAGEWVCKCTRISRLAPAGHYWNPPTRAGSRECLLRSCIVFHSVNVPVTNGKEMLRIVCFFLRSISQVNCFVCLIYYTWMNNVLLILHFEQKVKARIVKKLLVCLEHLNFIWGN